MYWSPGKALNNGQYAIEGILGIGGFGVTYRARDLKTQQIVAIKTLNLKRQQQADFEQLQVKFINEALSLAKCNHPNIVKVYSLFLEERLWCMPMEYVEGETLFDYRQDRGKLSQAEALKIIEKVGDALICVHQQNYLHRDIKPENILLRHPNLEPVLIDFGIAREFLPGVVQTHTNYSSENYAPIEQFENRAKRGAYTDIYALSVTLYLLLTGKLPVPAKYQKEANIPLIPPKNYNPDIEDRVNEAILWGLELEPVNRPQSIEEWFAKLLHTNSPTFEFEVITVNDRGIEVSRRRHQAQYFTENLGNGILLEMVSIPGGTFLMGSPKTELQRDSDESPQHRVTISPFFMGKYPVTQAQWQAVMGNNPSNFKGENLPVEYVSWNEAVEFCDRLSQTTGRIYRLPSEAEWEYACRAGTTTPFYFGETITPDLVNYNGNYTYANGPKGKYRETTTAVGSFPPNAFGLYDMHGNVWEWCQDVWHENYEGAPSDGSAWESGEDSKYRVQRGGSWSSSPRNCRAARRCRARAGEPLEEQRVSPVLRFPKDFLALRSFALLPSALFSLPFASGASLLKIFLKIGF